ncbi:MAG: hypothetical protein AAGC78_10960 [Cellvibrio sp.]|uniref:hypothetical protein n=1 Tax=Cellvibrio sp. TaxID=1965322 RepID=UPI0031B26FF0
MFKNNKISILVSLFFAENIVILFLLGIGVINFNFGKDVAGVYRLDTLQAQDSQEFTPMEGVEILKIFADGFWISPAYEKDTKRVVSLSGGRYTYDSTQNNIEEEVLFNLKDLSSIGLKTPYKIYLNETGFYQSGIYKQHTNDPWKVEERWIKE